MNNRKEFMKDFIEISLIWISNIFFGVIVWLFLCVGMGIISILPNSWNIFTAITYGILCSEIYRQIINRNEKRK